MISLTGIDLELFCCCLGDMSFGLGGCVDSYTPGVTILECVDESVVVEEVRFYKTGVLVQVQDDECEHGAPIQLDPFHLLLESPFRLFW